MLLRLRRIAPDALFVSARTGEGVDAVRELIDTRLPRPDIAVTVLVPYDRGDLVARIHDEAEVLETKHTAGGTLIRALVGPALAQRLRPFASAAVG
jgi:GTP-binding protein HflX